MYFLVTMRKYTIENKGMAIEKGDFHTAFSQLLEVSFESFKGEKLNRTTCIKFYTMIFNSLTDLLMKSGIQICNEAANYVAQCYYDGVVLNENEQGLDPNVFTQRAKLENIPTKDLGLIAVMLKKTDFVWPLIEELKRRN